MCSSIVSPYSPPIDARTGRPLTFPNYDRDLQTEIAKCRNAAACLTQYQYEASSEGEFFRAVRVYLLGIQNVARGLATNKVKLSSSPKEWAANFLGKLLLIIPDTFTSGLASKSLEVLGAVVNKALNKSRVNRYRFINEALQTDDAINAIAFIFTRFYSKKELSQWQREKPSLLGRVSGSDVSFLQEKGTKLATIFSDNLKAQVTNPLHKTLEKMATSSDFAKETSRIKAWENEINAIFPYLFSGIREILLLEAQQETERKASETLQRVENLEQSLWATKSSQYATPIIPPDRTCSLDLHRRLQSIINMTSEMRLSERLNPLKEACIQLAKFAYENLDFTEACLIVITILKSHSDSIKRSEKYPWESFYFNFIVTSIFESTVIVCQYKSLKDVGRYVGRRIGLI